MLKTRLALATLTALLLLAIPATAGATGLPLKTAHAAAVHFMEGQVGGRRSYRRYVHDNGCRPAPGATATCRFADWIATEDTATHTSKVQRDTIIVMVRREHHRVLVWEHASSAGVEETLSN